MSTIPHTATNWATILLNPKARETTLGCLSLLLESRSCTSPTPILDLTEGKLARFSTTRDLLHFRLKTKLRLPAGERRLPPI